jgi:hypothetical protein
MASITISELCPVSSEDSKSFLYDLPDTNSILVHGGTSYGISEYQKALEYALVGYAIYNIVSLVKIFLAPRNTSVSLSPK